MKYPNSICYLRLLAGDAPLAEVEHRMVLIARLRREGHIPEHEITSLPYISEIRVSASITAADALYHVYDWHYRNSRNNPDSIIAGFALIGVDDDTITAVDRTNPNSFYSPGSNIRFVGARPPRVLEKRENGKIRLVEAAPAHPHSLVIALDDASMDLPTWLDAHRRIDYKPHCARAGVEPDARASVVWAEGFNQGYNCVHLEGPASPIPPAPNDLSPGLALLWRRAADAGESAAQEDL